MDKRKSAAKGSSKKSKGSKAEKKSASKSYKKAVRWNDKVHSMYIPNLAI